LLYQTLEAVDGHRDYDQVAAVVSERSGRTVSADNIRSLVTDQLRPLGLLAKADGGQPELKRSNPLLGLRFRYSITDPERTRRLTAPFAALFAPLIAIPLLAAFGVVSWWVFFEKGLAQATYEAFEHPGLLLLVFAVTLLSAGFHEFGHAAAARRGGATPGVMGAGVYLVWPAFYTDVTDSYRLGRWGRVRTDLGGLYFNAIVAVAVTGVWWFSGYDALLLVVATQILQMLQQLTPLVRFDGYHVLADVTGVPDLFHRIKPTLLGALPWRWGDPEARLLKPWARAVVTLWVVVVVPLLLLALVAMVLTLPRILGTAWARIQQEQDLIAAAWSEGDLVQLAARVLTVLAVVLPVAAVLYMLFRLGRQVSVATWRATAGRPVRRTVAAVTALALAAALAWVWWPRPDTYRPIQPDERGTITDLVRPAAVLGRPGFAEPTPDPLASAAAPVAADATAPTIARGDRGTVQAVWDTDQNVPTEAEPVPAVVLIPRPDAGTAPSTDATAAPSPAEVGTTTPAPSADPSAATPAPTPSAAPGTDPAAPSAWVFPFNRPLAPEPGDNQALAENTTDGTVQYDVALAMVWVEGGEDALNTNEAYAFASCNTCASVAIAFQVVMVIGDNDVAVPQNLSGAVNYNCVNCLTYALAQQLFITLDGPLSEEARAQLDEIWAQIAAFGQTITGIPLDQIDDKLDEFQQQILDVIETDQPGTVPRSSPGADPSGTATASTTGPSPTAGGTTGPSPTAGTTSGPSPTSAPTGAGTATTGPTSSPTAGEPSPTAGPTTGPTSGPTSGPTAGPTTGPTSPGATAGSTAPPSPTDSGTGTASTDAATGAESSTPTP
ncbi:MAG TPA: hypothetical protein VFH10_04365, partial [Nocardioides sp.]|nr:hypothetical protein [Nocardioides sp.]